MRRIRYQVACCLDGNIAGPNGESDWISMDPDAEVLACESRPDGSILADNARYYHSKKDGGLL